MTNYQVNEIFQTVQGEGLRVGSPATFIRLQGCSVGCSWCDTKYTWAKGGKRMTVNEIIEEASPLEPLIVITGGEPTNYDLDELIQVLWQEGQKAYGYEFMVQLETSGQNALKGQIRPNWITWSPKPNLNYDAPEELKKWVNEIKFVVDDVITLNDIHNVEIWFQKNVRRSVPVVLMPEGTPPTDAHIKKALDWVHFSKNRYLGDRLQWRIGVR